MRASRHIRCAGLCWLLAAGTTDRSLSSSSSILSYIQRTWSMLTPRKPLTPVEV